MSDEPVVVGKPADPFVDDSLKMKVGEELGLKDFGDIKKNQHAVERIIEWARMKGAKDSSDLLWNVRQLANRVGSSPLGQSLAKHLSTYAYLEMERLKLDKELKNMEL